MLLQKSNHEPIRMVLKSDGILTVMLTSSHPATAAAAASWSSSFIGSVSSRLPKGADEDLGASGGNTSD